jgi:hypothetical protein
MGLDVIAAQRIRADRSHSECLLLSTGGATFGKHNLTSFNFLF